MENQEIISIEEKVSQGATLIEIIYKEKKGKRTYTNILEIRYAVDMKKLDDILHKKINCLQR